MNFVTLVQFATREIISSAENIQRQTRQICELQQMNEATLHQNGGVFTDIIIFFFPTQFIIRDNISSARLTGYRTDEIVRTNVENINKGTAVLHHRVSSVILDNAGNSIFCIIKIKKILERYVLKDVFQVLQSHLGSVCFE